MAVFCDRSATVAHGDQPLQCALVIPILPCLERLTRVAWLFSRGGGAGSVEAVACGSADFVQEVPGND